MKPTPAQKVVNVPRFGILNKRQEYCTNCGFLYWSFTSPDDGEETRIAPCQPYWRNRIQIEKDLGKGEDVDTGEGVNIACLRHQWIFSGVVKSPTYISIEQLTQPRSCLFYIKYEPGFSPEEHKELLRDHKTRNVVFMASIIGALIGASAAIIAQTLILLTR